jgi:hypothetical protein
MDYSVCANKLRQGIRYTFLTWSGSVYRADFDIYQSCNGIPREAVQLKNVEGLEGFLHMPMTFIRDVKIFALSKSVKIFPHLIPEVSMKINNFI